MVEVTCSACGERFSYKDGRRGRPRKYCDGCRRIDSRPSRYVKKPPRPPVVGPACQERQGTHAGYYRHARAEEPPCELCRRAELTYQAARRGGGSTRVGWGRNRHRLEPPPTADCKFCGEQFTPKRRSDPERPWTETCSKSCSSKLALAAGRHIFQTSPRYGKWTPGGDPNVGRRRWQARRALLLNVESEPYTLAEVAERDGYRCGICRRKVRMDLRWPDPRSASVDHIVPLSLGGEDLKSNTQLAHLRCNLSKGNRVRWGQQLLIG